MDPFTVLEQNKMPFAELLGIRILSAAPERLTAEMVVRDDLCTQPPVLHGPYLRHGCWDSFGVD